MTSMMLEEGPPEPICGAGRWHFWTIEGCVEAPARVRTWHFG